MKYVILCAALLLTACNTANDQTVVDTANTPTAKNLEAKQSEQLQNAANAVATASASNESNPVKNLHTEATGAQLKVASANLPTGKIDAEWLAKALSDSEKLRLEALEQVGQALTRADKLQGEIDALRKQHEQDRVELMARAKAEAEAQILKAQLDEKRRQAKMLTWLAVGFILGAAGLYYTRNPMMGTFALAFAGFLFGLSQLLMVIPNWLLYSLFGALGIATLVAMWLANEKGYWSKPAALKKGDYVLEAS